LPTRSGDTSLAWKSSGTFLDFLLPSNVGILNNVRFRFHVNNTKANNATQAVPPTCQWVEKIEVKVGTRLIETLFPNDMLTETVGFMTTDETNAKNNELAIYSPSNSWGATAKSGSSIYYLPFNNSLTCSRLYVAGVDDDITYRVYFPPNMFPSTFTLSSCTLEIHEDIPVDNTEIQRLRDAHRRGIVYNTIARNRQQTTIYKADANSNMNVELTGVTGKSAGLVIYVNVAVSPGSGTSNDPTGANSTSANGVTTPGTVPTNQLLGWRLPITTLELQDQRGNKRTETLYGSAQQSFVWWEQVGTEFGNNDNYHTYLLPFNSHFKSTVNEGANYGFMAFDGTDRLVLTAPFFWQSANPSPTGNENWVVTITNYVYNQLVFSGNKLTDVVTR